MLQYEGWHFVTGNRPPEGAAGSGGDTRGVASCLSEGSLLATSRNGLVYDSTPSTANVQWTSRPLDELVDAVRQADEQWAASLGLCAPAAQAVSPAAAAAARVMMPWSGNRSLAESWEALAAAVSRTPPFPAGVKASRSNTTAFNRYMYWDAIGHHNSELPYLLPLVRSA